MFNKILQEMDQRFCLPGLASDISNSHHLQDFLNENLQWIQRKSFDFKLVIKMSKQWRRRENSSKKAAPLISNILFNWNQSSNSVYSWWPIKYHNLIIINKSVNDGEA